MNIVG